MHAHSPPCVSSCDDDLWRSSTTCLCTLRSVERLWHALDTVSTGTIILKAAQPYKAKELLLQELLLLLLYGQVYGMSALPFLTDLLRNNDPLPSSTWLNPNHCSELQHFSAPDHIPRHCGVICSRGVRKCFITQWPTVIKIFPCRRICLIRARWAAWERVIRQPMRIIHSYLANFILEILNQKDEETREEEARSYNDAARNKWLKCCLLMTTASAWFIGQTKSGFFLAPFTSAVITRIPSVPRHNRPIV